MLAHATEADKPEECFLLLSKYDHTHTHTDTHTHTHRQTRTHTYTHTRTRRHTYAHRLLINLLKLVLLKPLFLLLISVYLNAILKV